MTNNPPSNARKLAIDGLNQLCVVGAGTTGAQIAQVAALAGYSVNLTDGSQTALERAVEGNCNQLTLLVKKGKLSRAEANAAHARVVPLISLEEAAGNADFVIEAIHEDLDAKRRLFRRLDNICPDHTILASNSCSLLISKIATDIARKDKVCNMHFFHPALVMQLVEIVRSLDTSDETVEIAAELGRRMGKEVVVMQKELFGFIVNNGFSHEIDTVTPSHGGGYAWDVEAGRVMRPAFNSSSSARSFEKTDMHSREVAHIVREQRHPETGDPRDKPPTFLDEMIKEGRQDRRAERSF